MGKQKEEALGERFVPNATLSGDLALLVFCRSLFLFLPPFSAAALFLCLSAERYVIRVFLFTFSLAKPSCLGPWFAACTSAISPSSSLPCPSPSTNSMTHATQPVRRRRRPCCWLWRSTSTGTPRALPSSMDDAVALAARPLPGPVRSVLGRTKTNPRDRSPTSSRTSAPPAL